MNNISFTSNELEIMELMWEMNRPLSRTEIIELTPNRSWSKTSIHILLNNLLEKGAIEVNGFVRTNKNYGRTYSPIITHGEYILSTFNQFKLNSSQKAKSSVITSVFASLIQDGDVDDGLLSELERMIKERKKQNIK